MSKLAIVRPVKPIQFTYSGFHGLETIVQLVEPLNRYELCCPQKLPILSNVPPNPFNLRIGEYKEAHPSF